MGRKWPAIHSQAMEISVVTVIVSDVKTSAARYKSHSVEQGLLVPKYLAEITCTTRKKQREFFFKNRPLKNTGLDCSAPLIRRFFYWSVQFLPAFFKGQRVVGSPPMWRANTFYTDFQLPSASSPVLFKGQL